MILFVLTWLMWALCGVAGVVVMFVPKRWEGAAVGVCALSGAAGAAGVILLAVLT